MKRPTKKPRETISSSTLLCESVRYEPDDLRNIADEMEKSGIIWVMFENDSYYEYSSIEYSQARMETKEEAEIRYAKELKKWKAWKEKQADIKEKQKEKLIKEAKKLGLTIKDD